MKPEKLQKTISAYQKSRIILSAFELDIFTILSENAKNLETIVKETGYDKRGTEILLNALCTTKLLKKKNNEYKNSKTAEKFLVKGKPSFWGNLYHTNSMYHKWSNITEIVRTGENKKESITNNEEEKYIEYFIAAMHTRAKIQAPQTAELLDLSKITTMLDIGGGSGIFSMAFINKNPNIKATVFDLPDVLPTSIKYIENEGFSTKIETIAGDYLKNNFPGNYDLILLSAIIHINSYEQNEELIKKCANHLNKNGIIVISDFILDEDKTGPERATFFAVNMLSGTKNGNTFTENEVKNMFENANIIFDKRIDTNFKGTIITGKKY